MVRIFPPRGVPKPGNLVIEESSSSGVVTVSYVPSPELLTNLSLDSSKADDYTTKLLELDTRSWEIALFPINTTGPKARFLKPKYTQIRKITLTDGTPVLSPLEEAGNSRASYARSLTFGSVEPIEDPVEEEDIAPSIWSDEDIKEILEDLPSAFIKDYDYGLGLAKPYRFLVEAVEELTDCTEIRIAHDAKTGVDEESEVFNIATDDFNAIRKKLNSTTNLTQVASRSVKWAESYNFFAQLLGRPPISPTIGRHPLRKVLTRSLQEGEPPLSEKEEADVIGVITRNIGSIVDRSPNRLVQLQNDIDIVNMEQLIDRFRSMLERKHPEHAWQEFMEANPFILSLSFGYPVIKVGQQASVGGRTLRGRGDRITDFLIKNRMTHNTAGG